MWPKEHGAYGQLLFPIGTALAVGRPGAAALLIAAAACFAFLGHEPLVVLLGQRGSRARREERARAVRWLAWTGCGAAFCGIAALALAPPAVRVALAPSAALAALLLLLIFIRRERSMAGELLTAFALASLARPIALASAASPVAAATCAAVFVAAFAAGTLGVRAVIARTRGSHAAAVRALAGVTAVGAPALLYGLSAAGSVDRSAPWAALPVCLLALMLAAAPPPARRLKAVGWSLVFATAAGAGVVIATVA